MLGDLRAEDGSVAWFRLAGPDGGSARYEMRIRPKLVVRHPLLKAISVDCSAPTHGDELDRLIEALQLLRARLGQGKQEPASTLSRLMRISPAATNAPVRAAMFAP
jgi:hypothetical protein